MLGTLIVALVSLLHGNPGMTFHEATLDIPAGISTLSTDMDWNAVTLFSTSGNPLPKISYRDANDQFIEWQKNEENEVAPDSALELLFVERTNPLTIKSEAPVHLVAHFFNTRRPGEDFLVEAGTSDGTTNSAEKKFEPLNTDEFDDPTTGLPPLVKQPKYISREEWGADENLLTWNSRGRFLQKWFSTEENLVEPQYRPKVTQTANKNGDALFWPVSESPKIFKIIIHHTAEATSERNPMEIMRAIYAYHTITRGWGDIGYNFVVDKEGNIYEGRLGSREGGMPVGAHTAYYNIGTIGVSLMGNFEIEEPAEKQMQVLTLLLAKLSRDYDVDPEGRSFYLGTNASNISGHRDVTRDGHETACPGRNLEKALPELRRQVAFWKEELHIQEKNSVPDARDFLQKSAVAPDILKKTAPWERPDIAPMISFSKIIQKPIIQRNDRLTIDLEMKNGTKDVWLPKSVIYAENVPEGMTVTEFRALKPIAPGESGVFRGIIMVEKTGNGSYDLGLIPSFLKNKIFRDQEFPTLTLPVQVSGDKKFTPSANNVYQKPVVTKLDFLKNLAASAFRSSAMEPEAPHVKVNLSYFKEGFARVKANMDIEVREKDNLMGTISAGEIIKIVPSQDEAKKVSYLEVSSGENMWKVAEVSLLTDGILEIENYNRGLDKQIAYNKFRNRLNFSPTGEKQLLVVNELPIEEYLYGLAEEPSTEPAEKRKAIEVAARNYALAYSGVKRKFNTTLYDLDDSPERSQFYLGYDWEAYHVDQKTSVDSTKGIVAAYKGTPVVLPYFTQSDGHSSNQWQKSYPWARVQELPFDKGLELRGHGVGMSGNSARELAKLGKNYEEILKYFFDGIEMEKSY